MGSLNPRVLGSPSYRPPGGNISGNREPFRGSTSRGTTSRLTPTGTPNLGFSQSQSRPTSNNPNARSRGRQRAHRANRASPYRLRQAALEAQAAIQPPVQSAQSPVVNPPAPTLRSPRIPTGRIGRLARSPNVQAGAAGAVVSAGFSLASGADPGEAIVAAIGGFGGGLIGGALGTIGGPIGSGVGAVVGGTVGSELTTSLYRMIVPSSPDLNSPALNQVEEYGSLSGFTDLSTWTIRIEKTLKKKSDGSTRTTTFEQNGTWGLRPPFSGVYQVTESGQRRHKLNGLDVLGEGVAVTLHQFALLDTPFNMNREEMISWRLEFIPSVGSPQPTRILNEQESTRSEGGNPNRLERARPTGSPPPTPRPPGSPGSPATPNQGTTNPLAPSFAPNPFALIGPLALAPLLARSPNPTPSPARANTANPSNWVPSGSGAPNRRLTAPIIPTTTTTITTSPGTGTGSSSGFCRYSPHLDEQIATLTGIISNTQLIDINNKLGPQLPGGGISQFLKRLWDSSNLQRVINLLTFITTLHNAYQLSNALTQTLFGAFDTVLEMFRVQLKDSDGNEINTSTFVGNTVESFFNSIFGTETVDGIQEQWKRASRIYQAATNILWSMQSIMYSMFDGLEAVADRVSVIGNALRKWGTVGEKAFGWMNPNNNFMTSRFFRFTNAVGESAELIETVAGSVIDIREQSAELANQTVEFNRNLQGLDENGQPTAPPPPPVEFQPILIISQEEEDKSREQVNNIPPSAEDSPPPPAEP